MKDLLIQKIGESEWWHVPPKDPLAYKKRGKFLASTYLQAKFYGKPNMESERVKIKSPVFGFSESEILQQLFGSKWRHYLNKVLNAENDFYQKRIELDAEIYKKAKSLKYDSIVLMTDAGRRALQRGHKPKSIELNLYSINK